MPGTVELMGCVNIFFHVRTKYTYVSVRYIYLAFPE
jgi:hypothetical protein